MQTFKLNLNWYSARIINEWKIHGNNSQQTVQHLFPLWEAQWHNERLQQNMCSPFFELLIIHISYLSLIHLSICNDIYSSSIHSRQLVHCATSVQLSWEQWVQEVSKKLCGFSILWVTTTFIAFMHLARPLTVMANPPCQTRPFYQQGTAVEFWGKQECVCVSDRSVT